MLHWQVRREDGRHCTIWGKDDVQCTIRKKEERKEKVERGRSLGTFAVLGLVLGFAGREGSLDNNGAEIDDDDDEMN